MFPQGASSRMVFHPDIAEIGDGIPENRGRPYKDLVKDPKVSCYPTFYTLDSSTLPEDWPRYKPEGTQADVNANFLRWLAMQPESEIVLVCHCNFMMSLLNLTGHITNCVPFKRTLHEVTDHLGTRLALCDSEDDDDDFYAAMPAPLPPPPRGARKSGGVRKDRRWWKHM